MNCSYSREILALFIEGDLPAAQAEGTSKHVNGCKECQQICRQLEGSQALIKSRLGSPFENPPGSNFLAAVRRTVFSQIGNESETLGWRLKIERTLLLGFRKHGFAFASFALVAVISASLLGQMRYGGPGTHRSTAAMFEGKDVLLRPDGYREWVFVGTTVGAGYSSAHVPETGRDSQSFQNIYVNPSAYREYAKTGTFPQGTVMVLERVRAEKKAEPELQGIYEQDFLALEASVKDSNRFEGGWGFFDFTNKDGEIAAKAQALPDGTCSPCHQMRGQTDHVFTQFYPVLRSARVES